MTETITTLLAQDFAGNQLTATYNELLTTRLNNKWQLGDEGTEAKQQFKRHTKMLTDRHTLAVTMDWIHENAEKAFEFLVAGETDKYVRNLYMVRLAVDDLFVGAAYHELEVGEEVGADALVEVLQMIRVQVDHAFAGRVRNDGTYTLGEVKRIMAELWYFMTCGLVGTKRNDLAYGTDILVQDGVYNKPETLVNTGDLTETADTVTALNALL